MFCIYLSMFIWSVCMSVNCSLPQAVANECLLVRTTRSIRRISTVWKGHLPFYMNFNCWSWEYKTGFGGRIIPTKAQKGALSASFSGPIVAIEPSPFFDEDAEAVRQKHLEEVREETEITEMTLHDKQPVPEAPQVPVEEPVQPKYPNPIGIFDDPPDDDGQQQVQTDPTSASSSAAMPSDVPQTPDVFAQVPSTPRQAAPTRPHGDEVEDQEAKRARVETSKKQRLERISAEYQAMVRTVKFGDETLHTMDEYQHDLQLDDHNNVDMWMEEEKDDLAANGMPAELWSDHPIDRCPPAPEESIDRIADRVELSRLWHECAYGGKCGWHRCQQQYFDFKIRVWLEVERSDYARWHNREMLAAPFTTGGTWVFLLGKEVRHLCTSDLYAYSQFASNDVLAELGKRWWWDSPYQWTSLPGNAWC